MAKFVSNRFFRIWSYIPSHSSLLLRSNRSIDNYDMPVEVTTIDIEVWDLMYIELPDSFFGLELCEIESDFPDRLVPFVKNHAKVFELTSRGNKHYIVAGGCVVGSSNWDYDQDRLSNLKLEYEEVLYKSS